MHRVTSWTWSNFPKFISIWTFAVLFGWNLSFAQTPITDFPCDPRSTANGGSCPAACIFAPAIEKGCNCFDNADNDGDGLRDAADPNCAAYFGLTFVGAGSACSITPPGGATIWTGVGEPATSSQNTADTQSKIAVGDVDNDGIPDAVMTSKWGGEVRVVATTDGQCNNKDAGEVKADYNLDGKKSDFGGLGCDKVANLLFEHESMIADIDGDGDAEIFTIVSNREGSPTSPPTCFFLVAFELTYSGGCVNTTLSRKYITYLGTNRPGTPGIADMDGDGLAEIYLRDRIFAAENGKLLASEGGKNMTNTALWDTNVTSAPVGVDMNGDGVMELVSGSQIYTIPNLTTRSPASPATLTLMANGNMNALTFDINSDGVNDQYFVKLMNDPLEYGVDTHSSTSVADVNEDGFLDVVLSGAITSSTGRTAVFYWDVQNSQVRGLLTPSSADLGYVPADSPDYANYLTGWVWGTGRVNIGDANGDGKPDLTFIAGSQLFCVTTDAAGNLVSLWTQNALNVPSSTGSLALGYRQINDTRSGVLTVTIYDFDNDGSPEVVYRDSQEIVVTDGETGTVKIWWDDCQSHTYTEGPVIADINGDGATDIAAACNTSNSFNIDAGIQQQALGQIRLWYSSTNSWLPTRAVWNQPGYFVVNVNDDLTLPSPQLSQTLVFGNTPCPNGIPGPNQPLNVFMNQVPNVSADGCPVFPAPDLTFFGDTPSPTCNADPTLPGCDTDGNGTYTPAVVVTPPICGNLGISVTFNIANTGDLPITDTVPVSFFDGDPTANPPGTRIHNSTINISGLGVGQTFTSPPISFDGPGTAFTLYILLYNDGSVLPVTLTGPSTVECSISNNMYSVDVAPDPITTTIEKLADNYKCINSAPDNGALKVHLFKGAVEVTDLSPYAFQWYSGIGTGTPIAGGTAQSIFGLAEGDYTVVVTDVAKGCTSIPVDTTIVRTGNDPTINLTVLSHQTKCNPQDGSLQADIVGGNAGFTFEWFDISLTALGITGSTANGLKSGSYVVRVTKDGCTKTSLPATINGPQVADPQAVVLQHVLDCSNPNTGSIQVDAYIGGVLQNPAAYTFSWYFYDNGTGLRGSILPPVYGTGQTRTGLPVGFYQAELKDNATACISGVFANVEVQSQTVIPDPPVITQVAPQTSCDPAQPNGALIANAYVGGVLQNPSGFTFEWFKGQNTLPVNLVATVSGTNGQQVNQVAGGGVPYTVRVKTAFNCSAISDFIVAENVNIPVVTLAQLTPNSICDPANAASPFNGSVQATVTFAGNPVTLPDNNYKFTWYDGTTTTTPYVPAPGNLQDPVLTGLEDGDYAVIVERTDLFCISNPDTEPVARATINPTLTATSTGSNNCAPGLTPDGTITVSITNTASSPGPFVYQWYDGNAVGVNPLGAPNNGTSATAIKVGGPVGAPKPYTVEVLNTATGCVNNTTQFVADNSVVPILSTTTQPNSICAPATSFNGSMTAAVDNIPVLYTIADYTFVWYDGATTATQHNPQPSPVTSVTLSTLDVGMYSVVGTNTKTGCVSAIATNQVANQKLFPTLVPSSTGSNNCVNDPGNGINPDGTVTVAVTVAAGPFNYQWYLGSGDPIAGGFAVVPLANNGQSQTATGLGGPVGAPISYTVLVTDQLTGCNNYVTTAVADNSIIPVLSTSTIPNSICAPATDFNGSMTVAVDNIPVLYTIADYTFVWYDGATTATQHNPQPIPATSVTLPALDVATYSVVGTNTKTGCVSAIATNQVADLKLFPTLAPSSTGSNNCVNDPGNGINPDGTASVTVTIAAGPFDFQWYVGSGDPIAGGFAVVPPANNGQSQTAIGLGGPGAPISSYTVLVTDQNTGCNEYVTAAVADNSVVPILSTLTTPNLICAPATSFDGTMTVAVDNIPAGYVLADYEFEWYDGATTASPHNPQPLPATTVTLTTLDVATYSVIGTNTKTGCVSLIATNQVADGKVYPSLAASSTGSNNCINDPGNGINPDGTAAVAVTVAVGPFLFQWYEGSGDPIAGALLPVSLANDGQSQTATGLGGPVGAPLSYTVLVTDQLTGCDAYTAALVADLSQKPTFTLTPTPNTVCAIGLTDGPTQFDGKVTVTAVTHPLLAGTITYEWFDADPVTGVITGPNGGSTTDILDNLDNGNYAATVTIDNLGCTSDPLVREVLDDLDPPVITTATSANVNCVNPNGSTEVTQVDGTLVGATTNYTYSWYNGVIVAGGVITNTEVLGTTLQGPSTSYTVEVMNKTTGCLGNSSVTVVDAIVTPTIAVTVVQNNTICDVGPIDPNGELLATIGSAGANPAITWAGGGGTATVSTTTVTDDTYTSLAPGGPYTAFVTDGDTGCESAIDSQNIIDDLIYPVIAITVQDQSTCSGTPNGMLTAAAGAGVTYTWYDGVGTAGATHGQTAVNSGIIEELTSDDYTVEVEIDATGCISTEARFVPNNIVNPSITFTNVDPVTKCVGADGSATPVIADLSLPTDYDIYYAYTTTLSGAAYPTDPNVIKTGSDPDHSYFNFTNQAAAPAPVNNLIPGYLSVVVFDNNTQCESAPATQQLIDMTVKSDITLTLFASPGLCGSGLGGIDPVVTPLAAASYTYEWYVGTPTNGTPIDFFTNPPTFATAQIYGDNGANLGINHAPPDLFISPGTFTLVVYDPDGCGTYKTDNVPTSTLPVVSITPTDVTRCDISNGELDVEVVSGTSVGGYSLEIFEGNDNTGLSKGSIGFSPINTVLPVINLAEGPYFIELIDADNPACPMGESHILVKKVLPPVITVDQIDPNTSCDPATAADGKVDLTVTSANGDIELKMYQVFTINPPVAGYVPPVTIGTGASGQSTGLISGFEPASAVPSYTITVKDDISKCEANLVVSIPDQPTVPSNIDLAISPETACDPLSNGSAVASLAGGEPTTIFDFDWLKNSDGTGSATGSLAGDGAGTGGELLNQGKVLIAADWTMGAPGQGSGDRTFYVQGVKNALAPSGVGCKTALVQVVIPDQHVVPDMTLTPIFDSFCLANVVNNDIGDGQIEIVADADPSTPAQDIPIAGFDYDWSPVPVGSITTPVDNSSLATYIIDQLHDGAYSVTITNADNSCTVSNNTTIAPAPYVITIDLTDPIIDQRICTNDGLVRVSQITLTDNSVGGPNTTSTSNAGIDPLYSFQWYNNAALTLGTELEDAAATDIIVRTLSNDGDQDQVTDPTIDYPNMQAGTYYVIATRSDPAQIGFGCPSLPFRVDVQDVHNNPVPQLTALSNTSCLPAGPGEGEILINVTDATGGPFLPGGGFTYTYTWPGPGPVPGAPNNVPGAGNGNGSSADADDDHYTVLLDDALPYIVNVENDQTGCVVNASATIVKNATPVFVQSVTVTDEILCSLVGDGSVSVTTVNLSDRTGASLDFVSAPVGPQGDIADFDFEWTRGAAGPQTTAGTVLDNTTYALPLPGVIGAGSYTVTARRVVGVPGAGCPSAPFTVTIQDKRIYPIAVLTPFSNTSCSANPLLQEGEIKVRVTDATTFPPPIGGFRFDYDWTVAASTIASSPSIGNDGDETNDGGTDNDYEIGLLDGGYTVEVTNSTTQCQTTASTTILKNALPTFVQAVTILDQLSCGPDGSLDVATVTLNEQDGTTQTFNSVSAPNISDFEFIWQRDDAVGSQTTAGTILNFGNYLPANFGGLPIGFDAYTVTARRINGGPGNGCLSTPYKVDILDKRIFPVVTLTPFANTSCSALPGDLEGEISIRVIDNTPIAGPATFTYTWNGGNPTFIGALGFPAPNDGDTFGSGDTDLTPAIDFDEDHPKVLMEGVYNMTVLSNKSLCPTNAQTEIFKNSTPVFTQLVTPTDQVLCTADGSLVVNEVRVIDRDGNIQSSLTDFPITDFDFTYSRTTIGNTLPGITAALLDNVNYPAIGADTYFVVATRVNNGPGFGCSSPEYKVDIQNKQIVPIVSLTPLANTSCDPLFFEGEIEVRVTDNSINLPAPFAPPFDYSYDWTVSATPAVLNGPVAGVHDGDGLGGGDTDGLGTDNDGDHARLLMEGNYTVSATNTQTGCASIGSTTIFKNSTPVFTQLVVPTPQVICLPDGMLQVQEVQVIDRDGNIESNLNGDFNLSDFAFSYDRGSIGNTVVDNLNPAQPVIQLDNTIYAAIGIDAYYVVATRIAGGPGLNCSSAPYKVDIEDRRVFPEVVFTSIANSACNVLKPNGSVTTSASEQDGTNTDPYTFTWTLDGGALAPTSSQTDSSPTSVIGNALDGTYVVTATNTVTGCPIDGSFTLKLDQTRSTPNIIDVVTVDPIDCLPSATAEVTKITLGSITSSSLFPPNVPPNNEITGPALATFTYEWASGTPTNVIPGITTPLINSLVPGTFYVNVQDPSTDCKSGPKEIIILDDNIIYPVVVITQTGRQISCIGTSGTAALAATGDGQTEITDPDYSFTWYQTLDLTGPVFSNTSAISSLTVGNYSVDVMRASTGCSASSLYVVPDDAPFFLPQVSVAGQPRYLCVGQDGQILSRVVNLEPGYPFAYDYTSDLYIGASPNLSAPLISPTCLLCQGSTPTLFRPALPKAFTR